MKVELRREVKKGTYLDISLNADNETATLYHKGEDIGQVEIKDPKIFNNRKLKAVVKDVGYKYHHIQIVRFADLHRHSGYSLLDGATKIEDMAEKTEYVGALSDHGVMYGFLQYYKAMKKQGKQPIVGFEAYAETMDGKKEGNHLLLLAKTEEGYKNLVKLTSEAYENFYNKPHVSYEMLEAHNEGIICLSACLGGEIPQLLIKEKYDRAKEVAEKFASIYGDDFYLEIQNHEMGWEEDTANKGLIRLSKELGIKLVATTDSHYTNRDDSKVHEVLLCLQTGKTLNDVDRMTFSGNGYHIHTADEMDERFSFLPEAVDNTLEIAEKCSEFELTLDAIYMPKFDIPKDETEDSYFEKLAWEGFKERFKDREELTDPVYIERMKTEIKIIQDMGFSAYFLIVSDFISYAKTNEIMVGPGRGSAVGSLVSYALGIVDLDPIPYDLLFERFLNPERVSMPDIDIDFCFERREEVIDYVKGKYGDNSVSRIITFGTLGARSVVRDVARVKGHPYALGDRIAKMIPMEIGMTLDKAIEVNPDLNTAYFAEDDVRDVIDTAKKIEGLPRHASQHACGVIISDGPVDNYLPETLMGSDKSGKEKTSQVVMTEVEELGLLKMDFLGLRTMTVIGHAIQSVRDSEGIDLQYKDIPHFDPYVYSDIAKGKTYGVFQLESSGMRSFMTELYSDVEYRIKKIEKKYKMKGFKDPVGSGNLEAYLREMKDLGQELYERLIAGISLYRPGPMDYIPDYISGMRDPDNIEYDHPMLEPILKATYGTIVYQESVMQIVQKLAGYTLGRADLVRRAMGKKKIEVMNEEKEYFINGKLDKDGNIEVPGCIRNGISKEAAEIIWHKMEDFSKYAFNKSHSAGYAMIAAVTAWLKYYYPVDFMAATMNSFIDKQDKLKVYLSVAKSMGIDILPPDYNKSLMLFSREGDHIIFGLKAIRNMGATAEKIIEERNARGLFKDFQDFTERMMVHQTIGKKVLEGMIYSGAVDSTEGTRRAKLAALEMYIKAAKKKKHEKETNQVTIFDMFAKARDLVTIEVPDLDEFEKRFKLEQENHYAGFYVTEHPLDDYHVYFKDQDIREIADFISDEEDEIKESYDGHRVKIAGIVRDFNIYYTKKDGKPLYVFKIEDRTGSMDAIMFSRQIENSTGIKEGAIAIFDGDLKDDDRGLQLVINSSYEIESLLQKENIKEVRIRLGEDDLDEFKEIFSQFAPGENELYVYVGKKRYKYPQKIDIRESGLLSNLTNRFGKENVKIEYLQ